MTYTPGAAGSNVDVDGQTPGEPDPVEQQKKKKAGLDAKTMSGLSPTQIAMRRLRHDKMAMICAGVVVFFILLAVFAGVLTSIEGQDYSTTNAELVDVYGFPSIGPNSEHWLGVEPRSGRDLFAQFVHGARPSLIIAFLAAAVSTVIGVTLGLLAGYLGGKVDAVISWMVNWVLSLPYLLLAISIPAIVITWFGGALRTTQEQVASIRFFSLLFVLVFFGWAGLCRLIRGEVISLKQREFVAAAKVIGAPTSRILRRELLPNLVAPIVINFSLALPAYIVTEAGLSFLGVGLLDPMPSWGQIILRATNWYKADPLYLWLPVLALSVLSLSLSWLGDSVRDAFDPKTRR